MKKTVLIWLGVSLVATFISNAANAADLDVSVTDIDLSEGTIELALFDNETAWKGSGDAVRTARIEVTGDTVSTSFYDLPPGRYAIKLFHDANSNGKMDTNSLGLPKEGYGFSGKGGRFGPPKFAKASFEIVDGTDNTVEIRLR
ncbi:MAG: DUF2141 domain-containing protein [Pseudomonadota bacterium]